MPSFENRDPSEVLDLSLAQDKVVNNLPIELIAKSFVIFLGPQIPKTGKTLEVWRQKAGYPNLNQVLYS